MKIRWTPTARLTYFKVLDYILEQWTSIELENFIVKTEHIIAQIAKHPYMFRVSSKKRSVRKGFITEHNTLYYRIKPRIKEIELITFWDNRQDISKINL